MNLHNACVAEFIEKFDASKDPNLWIKLINEEADELLQGVADLLKEYCDLVYVHEGYLLSRGGGGKEIDLSEFPPFLQYKMIFVLRILNALDELIDDDTFDEAYARVHASNMSKLGEDGKPIRREDGKIIKGPNYKAPDLLDLIY